MKRFETKTPINLCTFSTLLFLFLGISASAQEICDNGIDDDGDGLVDLNDINDCACSAFDIPLSNIPNPSFENSLCCPGDFEVTGEVACLEGWQAGTLGSADYLNTCGFTTEGLPLPLPDGNGAIGIIAALFDLGIGIPSPSFEYMTTCLNEPFEVGQDYTIQLSAAASLIGVNGEASPINFGDAEVTIYGLNNCTEVLPTTDCPEAFGWVNLGSVTYSPTNSWEEIEIALDINQEFEGIAIGIGCDLDPSYTVDLADVISPYFYFDNIQVTEGGVNAIDPLTVNYSTCSESATLEGAISGSSYQWYFEGVAIAGETGAQLTVVLNDETDNGNYGVVSTNSNGTCTFQEVFVEGLENNLIIGSDITTGCPPLVVSFDANLASGGQPLFWTVGDQEIEGLFFELTFEEPGVFPVSAQFTDVNGCVFEAEADPIVIFGNEDLNPTFEIQNNCSPYSVQLNVAEATENCIWTLANGDVISNECDFVYTYSGDDDFTVLVESTIAGGECSSSGSATIPISQVIGNEGLNPTFEILNNCSPFSVQLGVAEEVENCVWTLESGEVIGNDCGFVYNYFGDEDFTVEVQSSLAGCSSMGMVTIPVAQASGGNYSITGQTSFCEGDSSVFSGFPETNTYTWNGSTTGSDFLVTEAGEYSVIITEPDGCEYTEGFSVTTFDGPQFNPPSLITGCLGESLDLSSFTNADFLRFEVPEGEEEIGFRGFITVSATNECGTVEREVELDLEDCSCRAYVPNAFSPDGDGLNDIFKPEINCPLREYEMVIYNRWGNQVFRSETPSLGWNGNSGDSDFFAQGGIYAYQITYDEELDTLQEPIVLTGSVQVLR